MALLKSRKAVVSDLEEVAATAPEMRTPFQQAVRRFRKNVIARVGLGILAVLLLIVIFGPMLMSYDPNAVDLMSVNAKPSAAHLLGCDDLGRDLLTRLLYGGRISMAVGLTSAMLSIALGSLIGSLAGFYGGIVDGLLMRFTDLVLTIPSLPLLMVMGLGVLCSVFPLIAGFIYAKVIGKKVKADDEADAMGTVKTYEELVAEYGKLPGGFSSIAPIRVVLSPLTTA